MSGKNELQRLWTVFQSEKELNFYEKNVSTGFALSHLKYIFFVKRQKYFMHRSFFTFSKSKQTSIYNFGSFLYQMLDEKKKYWIFVQKFNEKFNVL